MSASPRLKLALNFGAVYLIWGSTYLSIRFAIETIPPLLMAGVRFLLAGLLMLAWARARGAEWPTRREWFAAVVVGVLLLAGGNGGVTWAEQLVPSGLAALLIASVPIWMVLLNWLRPGGVRPGAQVFVGVGLGLLGIILLVGPGKLAGGGGVHPLGATVLLLAAFSWATGSIYAQNVTLPGSRRMGVAIQMLSGGVVMLAAGLAMGELPRVNLDAISLRSSLAFFYLIIFGSLIGFSSYIYILQHATAARVSTYAYVNPVVAVFLGWALAGEEVSVRILVGAAIIVGAVAIITTYRTRRRPVPAVPPAVGQPYEATD